MSTYRKKPVVIEAIQFANCEWQDDVHFRGPCPAWLEKAMRLGTVVPEFKSEDYWYLKIVTLEGEMFAIPDDWIIQGVQGEIYPCKPDIFKATYELVTRAELR